MERYIVKHLIGKGRTGGVYQAEDTKLKTMVAMRRFYNDDGNSEHDTSDGKFLEIIKSRKKIDHPNISKILHGKIDEDGPFIISELITGDDLHAFLNKHHYMQAWQGMQLAQQILAILSVLHSNKIIHGSLGPSSINAQPCQKNGLRFVILDTSINEIVATFSDDKSIQQRGANIVMRPPELLHNQSATAQTDLYMMGQILYYMLSGAHPFAGLTEEELIEELKTGMPPLVNRRPDLDPSFTQWVDQLVKPSQKNRPSSANQALKSLQKIAKLRCFRLPNSATTQLDPPAPTVPTNTSPIREIRALPPIPKNATHHQKPFINQTKHSSPSGPKKKIWISIILLAAGLIIFFSVLSL